MARIDSLILIEFPALLTAVGCRAVPYGSGQLSLFRTIETAQDRTELPVNQPLGFEAVPNTNMLLSIFGVVIISKCELTTYEISVQAKYFSSV